MEAKGSTTFASHAKTRLQGDAAAPMGSRRLRVAPLPFLRAAGCLILCVALVPVAGGAAFADESSTASDAEAASSSAAAGSEEAAASQASSDATSSAAAAGDDSSSAASATDEAKADPQRIAETTTTGSASDSATFAGGSGTAADPYQVATVEQLEAFRDSVNAGTTYAGEVVELTTASYDLSGADWAPIGDGTRNGKSFTGASFQGIFEGNGATISGLTESGSQDADAAIGLFGVVAGGTVEHLALSGVSIDVTGSETVGAAVGILTEGGLVSDVSVSGSVSAPRGDGGIVGRLTVNGTIEGCINEATVSATGGANVGGIVGAAYYTEVGRQMRITSCVNRGAITGSGVVGGIVGLSAAIVQGCTNEASGTVTGSGNCVGGIVAEQQNYGEVSGCTNEGAVTNRTGTAYGTGGIVGWLRYDGSASDYELSAVIVVKNNRNSAVVDGGSDAAGIIGCAYNAATVTGNVNTAPELDSHRFAAGIVGNYQDDATPATGIPTSQMVVIGNVSTTPQSAMTGSLKADFIYDNPGNAVVENNSSTLPAQKPGTSDVPAASGSSSGSSSSDGASEGSSSSDGGEASSAGVEGSSSSSSAGAMGAPSKPGAGSAGQGASGAATDAAPTASAAASSAAGGADAGSASAQAAAGDATAQADGSGAADGAAAVGDAVNQARQAADETEQAAAGAEAAEEHDEALAAESAEAAMPEFPIWAIVVLCVVLLAAAGALGYVIYRFRKSGSPKEDEQRDEQ